jgi:alpha-glucosidase (family GH31 glycosyl hydrolase)
VRAGSIVPLGTPVLSTQQPQGLKEIRIYPGADATFELYQDDGISYLYEHSGGNITLLHWDDANQQFTQKGAHTWSEPDGGLVKVIHALN